MTTLQPLLTRSAAHIGTLQRMPRYVSAAHNARTPSWLIPPPRIAAPVKDGWHVFDARIISQFRADTKYTTFSVEGREYIISESLQALEQRLRPHGFMRVHRGALVNLVAVRAVHRKGRQASLELASGTAVPVSRRLAQEVFEALGIDLSQKTLIQGKHYLRVAR